MSRISYNKLKTDTIAFGISRIASKVISYFLLPLYTYILTSEEFGFADTITTLVNLLYPVMTLAISESVLRYVIDRKSIRERSVIVSIASVIIAISTLILLAAGPIVGKYHEELFHYWDYFIGLYLLINIEVVVSYFTKGIGKTKLVAVTGVVSTLVTIASNVLFLVYFRMGLNGYLLAMIVSYLFTIVFQFLIGRLWEYAHFCKFSLSEMKELIKYSAPMIVTIIAWWINTTADKYIIEYSLGLNYRGIYAAAYKIPTIISTVTTIFIDAWKLTLYDSSDEQASESFNTIYHYLSFFCCMLTLGLTIICELVARFMLGSSDYYSAWSTIPILAGAVYYSTMSGYLASIITKQKKTYKLLVGTLSGAVLNIITGILLIPAFGIRAAAATTMFGFLITWIIRIFQVKKITTLDIGYNEIINSFTIIISCVAFGLESNYRYIISGFCILAFVFVNRNKIATIVSHFLKVGKKT